VFRVGGGVSAPRPIYDPDPNYTEEARLAKFQGVVLLSIIDNASGREYPRDSVETFATSHDFNVVPKFDKSLAECAREDNPNEEGYVLTYPNGVKVKVKFAEYVRLHRILTGLNPKAVWEMLSAKQDEAIAMLLSDPKIPETFKVWLSGWVGQLRSRYDQLADRAEEAFVTRPYQVDWFDPSIDPKLARKTVAEHFQKTPDLCSILFAMLDDKDCGEIIWNRIRPKATDTFKVDV
jgi:RNA ligase